MQFNQMLYLHIYKVDHDRVIYCYEIVILNKWSDTQIVILAFWEKGGSYIWWSVYSSICQCIYYYAVDLVQ